MKNLFLVLVSTAILLSTKVQGQAIYNLRYEFQEYTAANQDQGPCKVSLTFSNASACIFDDDLAGGRVSPPYTFPASAIVTSFTQQFVYGGLEIFNYTNHIKDIYKTQSYYFREYGLRPGDGSYGARWTAHLPGQFFRVRIWPNNLKIQNVTGTIDESGPVVTETESITVNATAGFPADAYTWKYQIGNDTTKYSLPTQYQNKPSITFNAIELLGAAKLNFAVENNFKVNIILFGPDIHGVKVIQGTVAIITPKYNAPRIQSITPLPTKCNEDQTTSVRIKFDKTPCSHCKIEIKNNVHPLDGGDAIKISADSLNSQNEYLLKNVVLTSPGVSYDLNTTGYFESNDANKASQYYIKLTPINYTVTLRPLKLIASIGSEGIYCFGGQDGKAAGRVKGGTPPYALLYKNKTNGFTYPPNSLNNADSSQWVIDLAISDLLPAAYKVSITDKNGCKTADSVVLSQPAIPLSLVAMTATEATGYGLNNATLQITIKGGSLLSGNPSQGYALPTLTNSTGTVFTSQFVSKSTNEYTFLFTQLAAGDYNLRAIDGNLTTYGAAIRDAQGCQVTQTATIIQPPLLVASIEQTAALRCFGDATASLVAHAQGGRIFPSGLPYSYQWSYSVDGLSAYTLLSSFTDSILNDRKAGYYKVLVKDKNNNSTTATYRVTEPEQIAYDYVVKNVTCLNWTDGGITLSNLRGGTAPYTIAWPDGSSGLSINGLGHGTHAPIVSDALGCTTASSIFVKDTLNGITIAPKIIRSPTCNKGSDGSIAVTLTVERSPYTVIWNTGSTDTLLTQLAAGTYTVQVLNSNNCLKEAEFSLEDPARISIELPDRTALCIGQTGDFDLKVKDSLYSYNWTGPHFTSNISQVSLSNEGMYVATVENKKGCRVTDSVEIYKINRSIASQFTVSGQVIAGDEVTLVNITPFSLADTSVWVLNPEDMEILENSLAYARVIFKEAGTYTVGLRSTLGECIKVQENRLMVFEPTFDHKPYTGTSSSFIKEFEVRPIPNDGHFEVMIRLQDITSIKLRLLDFYSKEDLIQVEANDAKDYVIPMDVNLANGTYILFLETAYGTRITKVVILK